MKQLSEITIDSNIHVGESASQTASLTHLKKLVDLALLSRAYLHPTETNPVRRSLNIL